MVSSQGYKQKSSALKAIESIQTNAPATQIRERAEAYALSLHFTRVWDPPMRQPASRRLPFPF